MTDIFKRLTEADLGSLVDWLLSEGTHATQLESQEWLGLIELLTVRITENSWRVPTDEWMPISDAYARSLDMATRVGLLDRPDCVIRMLNLTSVLLRTIEPNDQVMLLSPINSAEVFFQCVPLSPSDAKRIALIWRDADVAEIYQLRIVKNLLKPILSIKQFFDEGDVRRRLTEWEVVLPLLP